MGWQTNEWARVSTAGRASDSGAPSAQPPMSPPPVREGIWDHCVPFQVSWRVVRPRDAQGLAQGHKASGRVALGDSGCVGKGAKARLGCAAWV